MDNVQLLEGFQKIIDFLERLGKAIDFYDYEWFVDILSNILKRNPQKLLDKEDIAKLKDVLRIIEELDNGDFWDSAEYLSSREHIIDVVEDLFCSAIDAFNKEASIVNISAEDVFECLIKDDIPIFGEIKNIIIDSFIESNDIDIIHDFAVMLYNKYIYK